MLNAIGPVLAFVLAFPIAVGCVLLLRAAEHVQRRGLSWSEAYREAWDDFREEIR